MQLFEGKKKNRTKKRRKRGEGSFMNKKEEKNVNGVCKGKRRVSTYGLTNR